MDKINFLMDIDGTIGSDISNEESHRYPDAKPFEGAAEYFQKLADSGHKITYFTSREEKDREITMKWLEKHGFPVYRLIMDKPRGGNYVWIDNHKVKGIRFFGTKWGQEEIQYVEHCLAKS